LACASCGGETKAGALFCGRCLAGIKDPTALLERLIEPCADSRWQKLESACMRIGPVSTSDLAMVPGPDRAVIFRAILDRGVRSLLPGFVEEYLEGSGVGVHLFGDELVPRRQLLWLVLDSAEGIEVEGEPWARASVRMGNVHALLVKAVFPLSLDPEWLVEFIRLHSASATALYARAKPFPDLLRIAASNIQVMNFYLGKRDSAIAELDKLVTPLDEEGERILLKEIGLLLEADRRQEAAVALKRLPIGAKGFRLERLRARAEGKR